MREWKLNYLAGKISMQSIYPLTLTKGHKLALKKKENQALLVKHAIVWIYYSSCTHMPLGKGEKEF